MPALRLVNPETGELSDPPRVVAELEEQIRGQLETIDVQGRSISRLRGRLKELTQKAEENHDSFPAFRRCHDYWRLRCKHPKASYRIEDFEAWLPLYDEHGMELCFRAIEGAAFDCFVSTRKNGSEHRHDSWELIHRSADKFREFANKAPYHLPKPEHLVVIGKALMFLHPTWELPQVSAEAKLRVRRWAT